MGQEKNEPVVIGYIALGCPKNVVDSERMLAQVVQAGCAIAADPQDCDVVIINTCGFIEPAKLEAFEVIAEAVGWKKAGSVEKIIVTGCLAQRMGREMLKEFPDVDAIVGLGQRDDITTAIQHVLSSNRQRDFLAHNDKFVSDDRIRLITGERHWAYLRISEGCDHSCSFCTIPVIRGPFRSKPRRQVLDEARELVDSGVVETNIIAQDVTSYGRDLKKKDGLAKLLNDLASVGPQWIRLMYLYPVGITDRLIETIAYHDNIVNYLDMPIQHISDPVLKAMRRPDNKKMIIGLIDKLCEMIPDIALRSTVIVGFPGETESQFNELLEFVQSVRFDALGCFKYYPESGTPAAGMPGQIPEEIKDERVDKLMMTQQAIAFEKNAAQVGSNIKCLVDSLEEDGTARARHYGQAPEIDSTCIINRCHVMPGQFVESKVIGTSDYDLIVENV